MSTAAPTTADVATIHLAGDAQLRIRLQEANGRQTVDVRVFEPFAGPARVMAPSKVGFAVPVRDLAELIEALKAAELRARAGPIGGGQ